MKGCAGIMTCHKKAKHKPADKKDAKGCDGTLACNPFACCAQCQYMPVAKTSFGEAVFSCNTVATGNINEYAVKGFLSDCWHPPEFTFA